MKAASALVLLYCLACAAGQAGLTQRTGAPVMAPAPALGPTSSQTARVTMNATSFVNRAPVLVTVSGVAKPTSRGTLHCWCWSVAHRQGG